MSALDNTPVAGAVVHTRDFETETDDAGVFRFESIEETEDGLRVEAEALGFLRDSKRLALEGSENRVHFLLHPAVEVTVLVVTEEGQALVDASVRVSQLSHPLGNSWVIVGRTDATGRVVLRGISQIEPQKIGVDLDGFQHADSSPEREAVLDGGEHLITMVPVPVERGVIVGRVTRRSDQSPIAGAVIELSPRVYPPPRYTRARTDAAGRYRVEISDRRDVVELGVYGDGWSPIIRRGVPSGSEAHPSRADFIRRAIKEADLLGF
ncbi:MAG: hypothetical protein AAF488_20115 [Planctomycetota bacterium]